MADVIRPSLVDTW